MNKFNFSDVIEQDYDSRDLKRTYTVFLKLDDAIKHQWFNDDRFLFKEDKEGYAYFEFLCSYTASDFYHRLKNMKIYAYTNFFIKCRE